LNLFSKGTALKSKADKKAVSINFEIETFKEKRQEIKERGRKSKKDDRLIHLI